MILAREVTKWESVIQPNHTYVMDDSMSKIYAYFVWNDHKQFKMFKNPMSIDTRYRRFDVIQRGLKWKGETSTARLWLIKGTKGHEYSVEETDDGMKCSCIGYKYHGKCKHIDEVIRNESK